ncbi:amidohydrolase family protein [Elongatibacter sediminis]|uniref:Amidohydrolase family protein n=1 Tax=Elongatibacter sediminis TaxID=3119006 RepID=A0AAW9R6H5_9GAMM
MRDLSYLFGLIGFLVASAWGQPAIAETGTPGTLVIHNARIVTGTGRVIENGSVLVADGRIQSVNDGDATGDQRIDAGGRTLMPGFIDGHRHIVPGDPSQWSDEAAAVQMQSLLDAGFTTVLSCGDPLERILQLRQQLADGSVNGPRLLTTGFMPLAQPTGPRPTVDPARAESSWAPRTQAEPIPDAATLATLKKYSDAGVDAIKTVLMVSPGGPEKETLKLIVREGKRLGLPVVTHAVTVMDTVAAVEAGVASLVHTPVDGELNEADLHLIAESGIPMMTTLGVFVPFFAPDNQPLFRDGTPFPWERLYHAGEGAVNARLLWNAGTDLAFGTDTRYGVTPERDHRHLLAHEIRSLEMVFSPTDIVTIMTGNAAAALGRQDEIGTVEAGKLADLVLLDGNPLTDSSALLNVDLVLKQGAIVADHRKP